ncbi:hypothetical protein CDAR_200501 [Caerostris darwini]|uniref:Uncharacterized protein n=1 Tax=Caerostris darwini TaxID=1538125 RepID=A0AAV4TT41_9ARAC|nr:hypothetical protein CDAR_200501 [Caerostris darwini]
MIQSPPHPAANLRPAAALTFDECEYQLCGTSAVVTQASQHTWSMARNNTKTTSTSNNKGGRKKKRERVCPHLHHPLLSLQQRTCLPLIYHVLLRRIKQHLPVVDPAIIEIGNAFDRSICQGLTDNPVFLFSGSCS